MLDKLNMLNRHQFDKELDPEIESRIAQYEMAFRMQTSVPDATDLSSESQSTFDLYGADSRTPGTFAANCLLARRLAERGVRFIQLYHQGWDHHSDLPAGMRNQCGETDQASAALVLDLKQRGLLDDTLVVWGGEFGRTSYSQGRSPPPIMAATIILAASRSGSPAAAFDRASRTVAPTTTATTSPTATATPSRPRKTR